jgi:hypothetical protein
LAIPARPDIARRGRAPLRLALAVAAGFWIEAQARAQEQSGAAPAEAAAPDAAAAPAEATAPAPPAGPPQDQGPLADTEIELHGYARMPIAFQTTPRKPYLVDADYFLSGFAYTRLSQPDWTELFLSASTGDYTVKFGLFTSLYSDDATTELESQAGIAQASVAARRFLGVAALSVELGVFWDRFGAIEPYDTYVFGRTHQGGVKVRYAFGPSAFVQAGAGAHEAIPQQNQGMTPIVQLVGGAALGPAQLGGYLIYTWTRDKPKLSPIKDGDLVVVGIDAKVPIAALGTAYVALAYASADQALFLAPSLELLHSAGGRGLTENYLGLTESDSGTGSLTTLAVDWPAKVSERIDVRVFGMATVVASAQASPMPSVNKDGRTYLKWGIEPGFTVRPGVVVSLRYDRVVLDLDDAENSFRVLSPRLRFPLTTWGELLVSYSHYVYGDKVLLRPGQVPLESQPDTDTFQIQAQARW